MELLRIMFLLEWGKISAGENGNSNAGGLMQKLPLAYWEQEEKTEDEEGSSDLEKLLCTFR